MWNPIRDTPVPRSRPGPVLPTSSCDCLNIRVVGIGDAAIRIRVTNGALMDMLSTQAKHYIVCLYCRQAVADMHSFDAATADLHLEDEAAPTTGLEFTLPIPLFGGQPPARRDYTVSWTALQVAKQKAATFSAAHEIRIPPYPPGSKRIELLWGESVQRSKLSMGEYMHIIKQLTDSTLRYITSLPYARSPDLHGDAARAWVMVKAADSRQKLEAICSAGTLLGYAANDSTSTDRTPRSLLEYQLGRVDSAIEGLNHALSEKYDDKPTTQLMDLPVEVLLPILRFACPTHTPGDAALVNTYLEMRSTFFKLSYVCHLWANLIRAISYQHIVLLTDPWTLHQLECVLPKFQGLVKAITLDGVDIEGSPHHILQCQSYLDRIIAMCPNLDSLSIYGDYCPFKWNKSLGNMLQKQKMQNNVIPVKRAAIFSSSRMDLGNQLQCFAPDMESLALSEGSLHTNQQMSSTVSLPNLKSLSVNRATRLSKNGLQDLLSISAPGTIQHLALFDLYSISEADLLEMLRYNSFGLQLTSLHLSFVGVVLAIDFPQQLLRLCPSLLDFSFGHPVSPAISEVLPENLQSLEVLVVSRPGSEDYIDRRTSGYEPLLTYIRSEKSQSLKRLSVVRRVILRSTNTEMVRLGLYRDIENTYDLRAECHRRGVVFSGRTVITYTI